uniref:Uncharacterized protein n=1 Tax=Ditylenchus dipsaci TaxID=166011 RepID=A0A915EA92_9BILA
MVNLINSLAIRATFTRNINVPDDDRLEDLFQEFSEAFKLGVDAKYLELKLETENFRPPSPPISLLSCNAISTGAAPQKLTCAAVLLKPNSSTPTETSQPTNEVASKSILKNSIALPPPQPKPKPRPLSRLSTDYAHQRSQEHQTEDNHCTRISRYPEPASGDHVIEILSFILKLVPVLRPKYSNYWTLKQEFSWKEFVAGGGKLFELTVGAKRPSLIFTWPGLMFYKVGPILQKKSLLRSQRRR